MLLSLFLLNSPSYGGGEEGDHLVVHHFSSIKFINVGRVFVVGDLMPYGYLFVIEPSEVKLCVNLL